ncbi:MAG: serine hydrolase [Paracoccaceae bacterium]
MNCLVKGFATIALAILMGFCAGSASFADTGAAAAGKGVMFLPKEQRLAAFRNMGAVAKTNPVRARGSARALPKGAPLALDFDMDAAMAAQHAVGLIVLVDGRTRYERYAPDSGAATRWVSFSVTKSITATLIGAALQDGAIRSLDEPVSRYVPDLAGSAYDQVSIRQLMKMSSGIRWNESYADPNSDVARLDFTPPDPGVDVTVSYMRKLPRARPAGRKWHYSTGDANLLGVVLSSATGKSLSRYLSEKIWTPAGMEADANWVLGATGHEIGGCCISMRLRDLARFGLFMLDDGRAAGGRSILPKGWVREATGRQIRTGIGGWSYGYQWWVLPDGSYAALGIFGQSLFIDPKRRLIVAMNANWPKASSAALEVGRAALFARIQRAVDRSEAQP